MICGNVVMCLSHYHQQLDHIISAEKFLKHNYTLSQINGLTTCAQELIKTPSLEYR